MRVSIFEHSLGYIMHCYFRDQTYSFLLSNFVPRAHAFLVSGDQKPNDLDKIKNWNLQKILVLVCTCTIL